MFSPTAVVLCLLPALALLAGCREEKTAEVETPVENPFAGRQVAVSLPAGYGLQTRWQLPVDEWSTQTAATVSLSEYESAAGQFQEGATLQLFSLPELPGLAAAGSLAPVPESLRNDPRMLWLDVFPGLREQLCSREGEPVAVPLSVPVLLLAYRADLLQQAGLQPPETWQDYDRLVATLPEWAPGLTVAEPWAESFSASLFLARAVCAARHPANYSVFFDIRSGEPLINGAPFVRTLEQCRQLQEFLPPESSSWTPDDCLRELTEGRAAIGIMTITSSTGGELPLKRKAAADGSSTAAEDPVDASARGRGTALTFTRLPGSASVYNASTDKWEAPASGVSSRTTLAGFAGVFAGVPSSASEELQQPAWNLLMTVTGEDQLTAALPLPLRGVTRDSQADTAATWFTGLLNAGEAESAVRAMASSLRSTDLVAELPVPGREDFLKALAAGVRSALTGQAEPQAALTDVAAQWSAQLEELGQGKVRDSYRRALGLSPLNR